MRKRLLIGTVLLLAATAAGANQNGGAAVYRVTVTNLTRAQVFSPPVVATHQPSVGFFELGAPASDELAALAENGMGAPLETLLSSLPQVFEAKATATPILPGASESFEVRGRPGRDRISVAGMLVDTNDAFFAIDTRALPRGRRHTAAYTAVAYDAGSEFNNEDCDFIPGPGCGTGSQARDTVNAEGYVYVSNGIHGLSPQLPSNRYDWHNPVARVVIERVR